jgi:hypothetical protein
MLATHEPPLGERAPATYLVPMCRRLLLDLQDFSPRGSRERLEEGLKRAV